MGFIGNAWLYLIGPSFMSYSTSDKSALATATSDPPITDTFSPGLVANVRLKMVGSSMVQKSSTLPSGDQHADYRWKTV